MDATTLETLVPIWEKYREAIAAVRLRTDDIGRRRMHHAVTLWTTHVEEVYGGPSFAVEWSDDGCTIDGHLFAYAA